jgi:Meiotically Up-regulated Gene 113 (MUG113) protein
MKNKILEEIRRTAAENSGRPLGWKRFESETGIRYHDWFGKYWKSWGDAVRDAGLTPNTMQGRMADDDLLGRYAAFVRELGRAPVKGDLRLKRQSDATFPDSKVFDRFGGKAELISRATRFCAAHKEWADVAAILVAVKAAPMPNPKGAERPGPHGFVYLIRSGKYHKIGRTNSVGRREYELGIQLPETVSTIHCIETDDPEGIEMYWHRRFQEKRARGEWFKLNAADVAAFKRRKFQ